MRGRCLALLTITSGALLAGIGGASAELMVSACGGIAQTGNTDVALAGPDGSDLTFDGVTWDDESLRSPFYWGLRVTRWLESSPRWGLAGELIHAKMFADLERTVSVSGSRGGDPVSGSARLGDTFGELSFSHGYNLLTVNGMLRSAKRAAGGAEAHRGVAPYFGLGLGVALPHVEVLTGAERTFEYQQAGPAALGLVGADLGLSRRWFVFAELKASVADLDAELTNGGSVALRPWTVHYVVGGSYSFGRPRRGASAGRP